MHWRRYALWIGRSFDETIPIINPSQPMMSCDTTNSWMMWERSNSSEHLEHVVEPLLRRYQRRRDCTSGWVLFFSSHCSIICADCLNASVLPTSWHHPTCEQDSTQLLQLGHIGLLSSWCARNFIVPAMPRSLAAQTWKSLGRLCNVRWMDGQFTSSNW